MPIEPKLLYERDLNISFSELRSFRLPGGITYAVTAHDLDHKMLTEVWLGDFKDDKHFKAVIEFLLEKVETGHYDYWIADVRFLISEAHPPLDWVASAVLPRAFKAGLKCLAIVLPALDEKQQPLKHGAFETLRHKLAPFDGKIGFFRGASEAKNWLLNQ